MMNSSKSKFLQRFNGKIGYITKHGQVMHRSSFDQRYGKKIHTLTPIDPNLLSKNNQPPPSSKLSYRGQSFKLSRINDRLQGSSFHSKNIGGDGEENILNVSRMKQPYAKQKLVNAGVNLLQGDLGGKKFGTLKSNSLTWQIHDQETRDFYQQLTNLQQSKVFSYTHNPKVHL